MMPSQSNPLLAGAIAFALSAGAAADIVIQPPVNSPAGVRPSGVALGDFTGNGFPEIATTVDNPDRVQILVHSSGANYVPGPSILLPASSSPQDIAAGDFNNNGWTDIAVAVRDPVGAVRFYYNMGDGVFTPGPVVNVEQRPRGISLGDVTGNGRLDLALVNRDSNSASVLVQDTAGNFAVTTFSTIGEPRDSALGDINGDGFLDLAVSDRDNRVIRTYIGPNWTPGPVLSVGGQVRPDGVAIGDLTNNGWNDIASAVSSTTPAINQVHVFQNVGGGAFSVPFPYNTGGINSSDIVIADLDCSGFLDVAVTNSDSDDLSILHNTGGSFAAPILVATGVRPGAIAAGDLDNNAAVDIVTANRDSDDITVVSNGSLGCIPCGPPGDLNCDGSVGVPDLLILLANWGPCPDPANCPADLTGSGSVGVPDLLILLGNWG